MINKENGFDLNVRWNFPDFRKHTFAVISLFILILTIYGNSLDCTWLFDDWVNIVGNPQIRLKTLSWNEIQNAFFATPQNIILGRSVAKFSFALNYYVGGPNVFGYHLVNIVIHLIASIFLYLLVYHTLNLPLLREKYQKSSYPIALIAAVLWASSPVHVNAVTYIVQRMASLAGMAYVMSMFFYLKARTSQDTSRRIVFFLLCVVAGGMAIASKENAVTLPIAIFLYDLFLIQGVTAESIRKNRSILLLIPLMVMAGVIYVVFFTAILDYQKWTFTIQERLLTEPRVFLFYISLLLYPLDSRLTLDHDIQISRSLMDPWSTLPAILLIVCAISYALWISRRKPLLSFCILFFFLNHLIEGTIIPLDLIYEHRNYIPSMLFFVPIAIFIIYVLDYFSYKKLVQFVVASCVAYLLFSQGHTVFQRNEIFKNELTVYEDNIEKYPNLSRPYNNLGEKYFREGYVEAALLHFNKASELNRWNTTYNRAMAQYNMGACYFILRKDDLAYVRYQKAIAIKPDFAQAFYDIGRIKIRQRDLAGAYYNINKAISIKPLKAEFHEVLSLIFLKEGRLANAEYEAKKAIALDPEIVRPYLQLAEIYRKQGKFGKAIRIWENFLKIDKMNLGGHLALIELYSLAGRKDLAARLIENLIYFTSDSSLESHIKDELLADPELLIYRPDFRKIKPVIKENLLQKADDIGRLTGTIRN